MGKDLKAFLVIASISAIGSAIICVAGILIYVGIVVSLGGVMEKEEVLNQCDGCMAGLPLVNGVHKDHQMIGIGCTKHLYVPYDIEENTKVLIEKKKTGWIEND